MNRGIVRTLLLAGALASVMVITSQANAGWHHFRGYGSPYVGWSGYSYSYYGGGYAGYGLGGYGYGGYGCGIPTYTAYVPTYSYASCYDPCYTPRYYRGCGLLSRWAYRCRTNHYRYYWGGCDPCCVTTGCSTCGLDDCGCGQSSGIIEYGTPQYSTPSVDPGPTPAVPPAADPNSALPEKQTSLWRQGALLTVDVPNNAKVLVNGISTRSTGDHRRYVSRNLTPGFDYTYEVKAQVMVDGKPVTQTKTVRLRAGQQAKLAFDMNTATRVETALTLHVPNGAKVYLAGNQTSGKGTVRTFRTKKLADGQAWSDYVVRVVVNENGIDRTKEETITLRAGDQRELTFDFNVDKIASTR